MPSPTRRLGLFIVPLALIAILVPAAAFATDVAPTAADMRAAELQTLSLVNAQRVARGLVPVRLDTRMASIARGRAAYMAQTGDFDHVQAGGVTVFDIIAARKIKWYEAGEIIAWNTAITAADSASMAVDMWMASPTHEAIIVSKDFNYAGFGMVVSPTTGRRYWAGVFLKGPDRTGAHAGVTSVASTPVDGGKARVVLRWSGSDPRLQVLTSGLAVYEIQRRSPGGTWYSYGITTSTSAVRTWTRGLTYQFRVRARDHAGNWGPFHTVSVTP